MRVLLVSYNTHNEGGAGISTYILAQELKKEGIKVFIASTGEFPEIETFVFKKFRFFPFFYWRDLYLENFLNKIIKNQKIDIVHSSESRFIAVGSIRAAKRNKIPVIVHYRSYWFNCSRGSLLGKNQKECSGPKFIKCLRCFSVYLWPWQFYKWCYYRKKNKILQQADASIAISQKVAYELEKSEIKNSQVVYNPIEVSFPPFDNNRDKEKISGNFHVGYLGEMISHKGVKNFLEIAHSVIKKESNIFFLMVGTGELSGYVKKYVKENSLESNIFFRNQINHGEICKFYKSVDMALFPFLWPEPFGRVIVEAMAFGKIVLASNRGGAVEIIADGKNGFLIDPENTESCTDKILEIFKNESLREVISQQAIWRSQDFKSEKSAKMVLNIYKNLLNKKQC